MRIPSREAALMHNEKKHDYKLGNYFKHVKSLVVAPN